MLSEQEFLDFQKQMRKFVNTIPIAPVLWEQLYRLSTIKTYSTKNTNSIINNIQY